MTNLAQMMQKAQVMKEKMAEMQKRANEREIIGEAGAGMVNITITGRGEVRALKLEPGIVNPDDIEVLEDLIVAAINDARKRLNRQSLKKRQKSWKISACRPILISSSKIDNAVLLLLLLLLLPSFMVFKNR